MNIEARQLLTCASLKVECLTDANSVPQVVSREREGQTEKECGVILGRVYHHTHCTLTSYTRRSTITTSNQQAATGKAPHTKSCTPSLLLTIHLSHTLLALQKNLTPVDAVQ